MRSIGVDLHKRTMTCCFLSERGKRFKEYAVSDLRILRRDLRKTDRLAVEATGNARWFSDQVKDWVEKVVVVNPRQFKVISQSVRKTDETDAELLALFLSKGLLPEIRMRDELSNEIKSLCVTRDKLVKLRTSLKNKIHNILNAHGIQSHREDYSSEKGLRKVFEYPIRSVARVELEVIVEQIRHLNEGIKRLDREIEEKGQGMKGFENITSIKGIGPKGGAILLSVIGDIEDFESSKKLESYFGIVPKTRDSGDRVRHGKITKQGSKLGRTTLVQCTLIAIKYSPYLRHFYLRLKQKKGSGKAIIATSRKLLGVIYQTLKNNWIFEDFGNFVIRTT
jgi:transposase